VEEAARPDTDGEERIDGAAPEQPVGQAERTGPVPAPKGARDEGAMVAEEMPATEPVLPPALQPMVQEVVPVVEMPPKEGPEQAAPNAVTGAVGVAPISEGGLNAK